MGERLNDTEYAILMNDPKVRQAMEIRCEEQDHTWDNCCSIFMELYQECKWCKTRMKYGR